MKTLWSIWANEQPVVLLRHAFELWKEAQWMLLAGIMLAFKQRT